MCFEDFFRTATTYKPFAYQTALALEPLSSRVIRVPTGSGKTEAAILPWIWKTQTDSPHTPKRLIVFVPMRSLVTQTVSCIQSWLKKLELTEKINLVELLGEHAALRERNRVWAEDPERSTILVGTVDLLLSAALNRGYAMSRFRWPVAFGLLHNSALWVVDEVQLMGSATATFAQLESFRATLGTQFPVFTWWMSATVEPDWLRTVDFVQPPDLTPQDKDRNALIQDLGVKYSAKKPIRLAKSLDAESVRNSHQGRSLTLVVVNTVRAARELYRCLAESPTGSKKKRNENPGAKMPEILLLHSRFRPVDRKEKMDRLIKADLALRVDSTLSESLPNGALVVATQVIEAGVDVSARTLWTELAPWSSMVQRFGRLNRDGKETAAQAILTDVKDPAPYTREDLDVSRERFKGLKDVGPSSLESIPLPAQRKHPYVLRRHDLIGLFSTDKDLAGGFTDVSNYIRDSEDRDVYIGWREFKNNPNYGLQQEELAPFELCAVPIGEAKEFRSGGQRLWEWNDETDVWEPRSAQDLSPGMVLLCAVSSGGYSEELGWTGSQKDRPSLPGRPKIENDSSKRDPSSISDWVELQAHLADVEREVRRIGSELSLDKALVETLALAARWHDIGKSLPRWQEAARRAVEQSKKTYREGLWAKFPADRGKFRPGLRHEEASALYAAQLWIEGRPGWSELAVYLIACHHGKVRTTLGTYGVKSINALKERTLQVPGMIDEPAELNCELLHFAGTGRYDPTTDTIEIGGPSWATLVCRLVGSEDEESEGAMPLGPFRLAFFEALIVAADIRATRGDKGKDNV